MIAVDIFKFKKIKETSNYGKYEFAPLPMGYGNTIGNALRRILLSSIEGAAITSVRIKGVKHEYSVIPGVYDDVLTILLRLKQLELRSYSDEPQTIELKVSGIRKVTAKDIKLTSAVEIANPDFEITSLTKNDAKLEMSMQVEKGTGYRYGDESKREQIGTIPLDASFSPVKRVVLNVSQARVGQRTDFDQINLEIFTNEVILPGEALKQAVEIYKSVVDRLVNVVTGIQEDEKDEKKEKKSSVTKKDESSSDLDIEKLNLSARLTNSLLRAGIKNLTELEGKSVDEIMDIRGLGAKSAEELIEIMKSYKLKILE